MKKIQEIFIQISTGLLILVIIFLLVRIYNIKETEYCIDILYGDKYTFEEYILPKRNFKYFQLSGNVKQDNEALFLIKKTANEMISSQEDSVGMKIVLGNKLKYKTYIALFNICLKSGLTDWVPYNDTVLVFHIGGSENQIRIPQNSSLPGMYE
jgi:hypothetical protein